MRRADGLSPGVAWSVQRHGRDIQLSERNYRAHLSDVGGRRTAVLLAVGGHGCRETCGIHTHLLLNCPGEIEVRGVEERRSHAFELLLKELVQSVVGYGIAHREKESDLRAGFGCERGAFRGFAHTAEHLDHACAVGVTHPVLPLRPVPATL